MRWSRTPRPCSCTSPKGYWCTRTDRHVQHQAAGGTGQIYSRWRGDFPNESEFVETFTTEAGIRKAVGNDAGGDLSPADHNDHVRAMSH